MNKFRFPGYCTALGALVVLGGCVAVPAGPGVYSDGGYYSGYPETVYAAPAPVVVAPPVYIGGGYSHGPRYWGGHPGYYGPRPGWGGRPGYGPPPVAGPGPGVFARPGVPVVPRPGIGHRYNIAPFSRDQPTN